MNRFYILAASFILVLATYSCKTTEKEKQAIFDLRLSAEEIEGGIMTPEILWKFRRMGSICPSPDGKTVLFTLTEYNLADEARRTNIFSIPSDGGEIRQLTDKGGNSPSWIMDGDKIAFASQGALWTMNPDGSGKKKVKNLENFETYSISPQDNMIYFTRRVKLDQTPNEKHGMPLADMRIIDDLMFRHWNYWHDYSYSHVFIAFFDGESVTGIKDIMEGQKYESPTAPWFDEGEISWSPDGKKIAYTSKKLRGKEEAISTNTDIYLYDTDTESTINISEGNEGFDHYPVFSPDGSKLAWQSQEEDGYEADLERLFIYDFSEQSISWPSEGWDYNIGNIRWSSDGGTIYFSSPYLGTAQIFNIDLSSGEINQVSSGKYDYSPVAVQGDQIITGIQSMSMPTEIAILSAASGDMNIISSVNGHISDHIKMGETEERYIKTSDGKDLQMWIIYPPDFDPSKQYPALLYCKGGPQGPLGQSWSYRWNYQMMAANGYIVVAPNRRGNSGFGSEWREQISGDYGGKNMQDYLDAIDYMAAEPYIDEERLGAVGASYGGYSVFYLAGIHEGRFKALISHCGMFNIESWYGSTEELWFPNKDIGGPYWEEPKPAGYKYSPHLYVDRWTAPIMIIVGEHDYRIPYTQSLEAFTAAQLKGVPSKLLFFHDETHFVTSPQNAVIWQREFFEWLDTYLK
ncbi:MAG TPA: S9 family peptidase [Bacteroidetes bacterium]|nr:S9 family peptidase [Bacteroidota bacterium]